MLHFATSLFFKWSSNFSVKKSFPQFVFTGRDVKNDFSFCARRSAQSLSNTFGMDCKSDLITQRQCWTSVIVLWTKSWTCEAAGLEIMWGFIFPGFKSRPQRCFCSSPGFMARRSGLKFVCDRWWLSDGSSNHLPGVSWKCLPFNTTVLCKKPSAAGRITNLCSRFSVWWLIWEQQSGGCVSSRRLMNMFSSGDTLKRPHTFVTFERTQPVNAEELRVLN